MKEKKHICLCYRELEKVEANHKKYVGSSGARLRERGQILIYKFVNYGGTAEIKLSSLAVLARCESFLLF